MSVYFSFSLTLLVLLQAESSGLALNWNPFLVHLQLPCTCIKMKGGNVVKLWQSRHGRQCQGLIFCDLLLSFCNNRCQWRSWDGAFACRVIVTYCAAGIMQNSLQNPLCLQPCMQSCLPPPLLTAASTIHWKKQKKNTPSKLEKKSAVLQKVSGCRNMVGYVWWRRLNPKRLKREDVVVLPVEAWVTIPDIRVAPCLSPCLWGCIFKYLRISQLCSVCVQSWRIIT